MGEAGDRHDWRAPVGGPASFGAGIVSSALGEDVVGSVAKAIVRFAAPAQLARTVAPFLQAGDSYAFDPARVGIEHLEFEQPGAGNDFTAYRQSAGARHQIAANGIDFLGGIADVEIIADSRQPRLRSWHARRRRTSRQVAAPRPAFVFIVLVADLTHDLLDDVLDRRKPVGSTIFVDHERKMNSCRLHTRQQIDRPHRRRHKQVFRARSSSPTAAYRG